MQRGRKENKERYRKNDVGFMSAEYAVLPSCQAEGNIK